MEGHPNHTSISCHQPNPTESQSIMSQSTIMSINNSNNTHPSSYSSASGLLAMLSESSPPLRSAALHRLLQVVDTLWHEVSESLPELEAMAEDSNVDPKTRSTAAAVASRVFFHLEEPYQALRLALEGGDENFDVVNDRNNAYVERLVSAAIDAYIKLRRKALEEEEGGGEEVEALQGLDVSKLEKVVQLMFLRCYNDGHYGHALGVALEAREVEKVKEVLKRCPVEKLTSTLEYALDAAVNLVSSKTFRDEVLSVIGERLEELGSAAASLCVCHQLLNRPEKVANSLEKLLDGSEEDALLGYQICFDLVDSGDQSFVSKVAQFLPSKEEAEGSERADEAWARHGNAERVLVGGFGSELALSFLHKQSDSDKLVMENLKRALEERGGGRNSVLHNCAVVSHAYLNAGTTNDSFLREHLDWMRKASNWAKFSATATLGVLHAGHTTEAMALLEPYLPQPPSDGDEDPQHTVSPSGGYAEGGSLLALGLIHGSHAGCSASKRKETADFLRKHLRASHANEVISHGAALAVGLTSFGTNDDEVVSELKELLYTDSAVAGEAAGTAIGLVLVGTGTQQTDVLAELKNYARETQHEKIIRGIALALALVCYGQEENADALIEEMRADRDPILRYGAQYAIAMAYCGTNSNKAIRILLHTAVSDVKDDVRMAAVIALAFVLYKTPERVPQLVKLLLESFNPHVRYASCMAVGIAMAGTANHEAIALIEPMLRDMTDFVRQGALLATAMMYMQQSDTANNKKIKTFRDQLTQIVSDKHQTTMAKMGATLATGLLDAGGRNCSLDLGSRNGFTKITSAVGIMLWLQYWHWYPMMHMLSLALTPTFTIGLNKDFKYPKLFFINCNAKPSAFAYPKRLTEKKEEKKKRVETVTLSTTAKNKARLARKRAKEEGIDAPTEKETQPMEIEKDTTPPPPVEIPKKKREPEPTRFQIANPSRITKSQVPCCAFDFNQRYKPVRRDVKPCGVIVLVDSTPEKEEEDLGAVKTPSVEAEDEVDAPEPFEWAPPGHAEYREVVVPSKKEETAKEETKKEEEKE